MLNLFICHKIHLFCDKKSLLVLMESIEGKIEKSIPSGRLLFTDEFYFPEAIGQTLDRLKSKNLITEFTQKFLIYHKMNKRKSIRIFYPCGATSPIRRKRPLDYNNASYGLEL